MALAMLIPFAHNIVFGVAFCTTLILFVLAAVGCKAAIAKGEGGRAACWAGRYSKLRR